MAQRPVFIPVIAGPSFVEEVSIEFRWFAGMAVSQKQKSIASLHEAAKERTAPDGLLEISSKSTESVGVQLSAFNLMLRIGSRLVCVEAAYQAGKCFERGGPFVDLLDARPWEAKRDARLNESGRLIAFEAAGERWPLEPATLFYDWLYLRGLADNPLLAQRLLDYGGFTDIEFNPERSLNCQARSAALYVSLHRRGCLDSVLSSREGYMRLLGVQAPAGKQISLF